MLVGGSSMKNVQAIIVLCLLIVAIGTGCEADSSTGDKKTYDSDRLVSTEQALELYKANCLACHASDLQGNNGPDLRNVGEKLNETQIAKQKQVGGEEKR
jgi:cytochrome c551